MLGRVGEALRRMYEPEAEAAKRIARVPAEIQAKLAHLDELASEAMDANRDVQDRLSEARSARRDATQALEGLRAEKAEHVRKRWVREDDPDFADFRQGRRTPHSESTLEAMIAEHAKAIQRLETRAVDVQARSTACGRLAQTCQGWARDQEPEGLADLLARAIRAVPTRRVESSRLPDELAKARSILRALADERAKVEVARVPLADARARLFAFVDGVAAEYTPEPGYFLQNDAGSPGNPESYTMGALPVEQDLRGMRAFLVYHLRDAIKASLSAALEREAEKHELLLPPADRIRRLEQLDAKVYAAGLLEEWLIVQHEAASLAVVRRQDAAPACVLCVAAAHGAQES